MGVIIQSAVGAQSQLLGFTKDHHKSYADLWGHEYVCKQDLRMPIFAPFWVKLDALYETLARTPDGTVITWLDADSVIVWAYVDICTMIGDNDDIGMVFATSGVLNSGVITLRNSPRVRAYIRAVRTGKDCAPPTSRATWDKHYYFNTLLADHELNVKQIDPRFNFYRESLGEQQGCIVIRSFHDRIKGPCLYKDVDQHAIIGRYSVAFKQNGMDEKKALECAFFSGLKTHFI